MKRQSRRKIYGYTLIEIIVAIGLFAVMMGLVNTILRIGQDQIRVNDTKMNLQESAREALSRMSQEIRESSPSRITVTNGGGALSFQIPASVNNSGTITWSAPIVYQVGGAGSQLIRTDTGTGLSSVVANDIQNLSFNVGGPEGSVNMVVTAQRNSLNGRPLSVISTGEAKLRNT